jgi:tRNA-specific 2-thiouridylase
MANKSKTVFVAMSGGVDSSVAALLLKKRGFNVVGVFIKTFTGNYCNLEDDFESAFEVANILKIPLYSWNFENEYRRAVFEYMLREYQAGRTPNPDVMCNKAIKFGIFFEYAMKMGADFVATGHYARCLPENIKSKNRNRKYLLLAGIDKNKDQSYFLWTLTQEHLAKTLFPIGEYTKPVVRSIARRFGLPNSDRKDSQGLCFVGKVKFDEFLSQYINPKPGYILNTSGEIMGMHKGIEFYTIGQRQGIGIGGGTPYYVVEKNAQTNTITVAAGSENPFLYKKNLVAGNLNWISGDVKLPLRCLARVRYRQPLEYCTIFPYDSSDSEEAKYLKVNVVFDKPQRAIAPGQSVVFYTEDDIVLGGGIIETSY